MKKIKLKMKVLECSAFYIDFSRHARGGINYVVSGLICLKFEIIQAFMRVLNKPLMSCKNREDPKKMKTIECSHYFSYCKSMGIFSDVQGQLTPQCMVHSG